MTPVMLWYAHGPRLLQGTVQQREGGELHRDVHVAIAPSAEGD